MRLLFLSCKDTNYNSFSRIAATENIAFSTFFDALRTKMHERCRVVRLSDIIP